MPPDPPFPTGNPPTGAAQVVRLTVFLGIIALAIGLLIGGYPLLSAASFVVLVVGVATQAALRLTGGTTRPTEAPLSEVPAHGAEDEPTEINGAQA